MAGSKIALFIMVLWKENVFPSSVFSITTLKTDCGAAYERGLGSVDRN